MQRLEVSGAVRPIYGSLGVKRLNQYTVQQPKEHHYLINNYSEKPKTFYWSL